MKTLIFSDTHLDHNFDQKRFDLLKDLIEQVDRVIINGDFWDVYLTSWEQFLNSEWNKLFPLLKQKESIYIFGNHDKAEWMDDRMSLFSNIQTSSTEINIENKKLIIQHGNEIYPSIEEKYPRLFSNKILISLYGIYDFLSGNVSWWFTTGHFENRKLKQWVKRNFPQDHVLVCGHTHLFEDNQQSRFINTGLIRFGYLQYAIVTDDQIEVFDRRY